MSARPESHNQVPERPGEGSTSRSLLAAARDDNPAAWSRLVALYSPFVETLCLRAGVSRQEIKDVAQEVFTAVALNLERFRRERPEDTFRGWLATIARHKACDYFRRQAGAPVAAGGTEAWQRLAQICEGAAHESSQDSEETELFGEVLQRALEAIRAEFHEQTWQAFWHTVVEDKSAGEVALELGMQSGAVRVAKSRVLCRLRKELGDEPSTEEI